jgi:hypothetical protein
MNAETERRTRRNRCSRCGYRVGTSKASKANRAYNPDAGTWDHVDCDHPDSVRGRLEHRAAVLNAIARNERLP